MRMPKLKFIKDCGKLYPASHVTEDTPEIRSYLASGGYLIDEDFGEVVEDSRDSETESDASIDRAVEALWDKKFGDSAERIARKVQVTAVAEGIDRDPRRGYRSVSEFAMDVIMASDSRYQHVPEQKKAVERLGRAQAAERAHINRVTNGRITASTDAINTLTGPAGAYLMAHAFSQDMWTGVIENSAILDSVTKVGFGNAKDMQWPMIDGQDHSGGTIFGGVKGYWVKDAAQATTSRPTFATEKLAVDAFIVEIPVTREMEKFSMISIAPLMGEMARRAIAWQMDDAVLVTGTGAGMPQSILNSPALISVARNTASKFLPVDANLMYSALPQRFKKHGSAVWVMTQDFENDMQEWNAVMGTAGQLLYMPPGGLSGQPYSTLKGLEIRFSEHCNVANTVGDVMLIAPSEYVFAQAGEIEEAYSIHLLFDYATSVFRWIIDVGGMGTWKSALTPHRGVTTQSPFITLAAG
jgi:HK97 family phage major capsid protein